MLDSVPLRLCAVRDALGHLLYVATLEHGRHALEAYSRRWTTLSLFKFWKGSGVDLEETHVTHPDRLSTLLALVTLTSVWVWEVGAAAHERQALSIVRNGLDTVKATLVNVLWSFNETLFVRAFLTYASKLSPT